MVPIDCAPPYTFNPHLIYTFDPIPYKTIYLGARQAHMTSCHNRDQAERSSASWIGMGMGR